MEDSSLYDKVFNFNATSNVVEPQTKKHLSNKNSEISLLPAENLLTSTSPLVPITSSTLNESTLHQGLESCNISSFTQSPYFNSLNTYSSLSTFNSLNTYSSPNAFSSLNTFNSLNATPIKEQPVVESEFFKKHTQSSAHSTPTKSASLQKLGSPERNEILYGPTRSSSAKNLLSIIKKRCSPAKKRLFEYSNQGAVKKSKCLLRQHLKHDPVAFFGKERNLKHILERIFEQLSDQDLYSCQMVSSLWSQTLLYECKSVQTRLEVFTMRKLLNKENCVLKKGSHTSSLSRTSFPLEYPIGGDSFLEIAQCLTKDQHLEKCPNCGKASIVEHNIGQCQKFTCGYIYCTVCNSCSTTGPENFTDKCQGSALLLDKPKKRRTLLDSPPRNADFPSFLYDSTNSHSSSLRQDSGYQTESESQNTFDSSGQSAVPHRKSLGNCNRNIGGSKTPHSKLGNYVPVQPIGQQQRKRTAQLTHLDLIEPQSPPKVRSVAGSAKSKRNLKRLLI